jgi:hypothetical protein
LQSLLEVALLVRQQLLSVAHSVYALVRVLLTVEAVSLTVHENAVNTLRVLMHNLRTILCTEFMISEQMTGTNFYFSRLLEATRV